MPEEVKVSRQTRRGRGREDLGSKGYSAGSRKKNASRTTKSEEDDTQFTIKSIRKKYRYLFLK